MDTNSSPTLIKIEQITRTCPAISAGALEQAELQSALEEYGESLLSQLSRICPQLYAVPVINPEDFESAYLWFLS